MGGIPSFYLLEIEPDKIIIKNRKKQIHWNEILERFAPREREHVAEITRLNGRVEDV